jgi:hypothetical protein
VLLRPNVESTEGHSTARHSTAQHGTAQLCAVLWLWRGPAAGWCCHVALGVGLPAPGRY